MTEDNRKKSHNRLNLVGQKFHKLTVLETIGAKSYGTRHRVTIVKCQCDCGVVCEKIARDVKSGNTKSCGCWELEERKLRAKNKDRDKMRLLSAISQMKSTARKKGYEWALTDDEALNLIKQNCSYCNAPPSNIKKDQAYQEEFTKYSGIDRKNNDLGYFSSNCQSLCWTCNSLKVDYDESFFLNHVRKMTYNLDSKKFDLLSLIKDPSLVQELAYGT